MAGVCPAFTVTEASSSWKKRVKSSVDIVRYTLYCPLQFCYGYTV